MFVAVIGAALLHAAWNALVKGGDDKRAGVGAVVLGHAPFALAVLPFVPLPAAQSLPYLAAGTLLHVCYQLFLMRAYELGDLTQVYPIARGSAPLIVALISVTLLGVRLESMETLGVLVIGMGIVSLSLVRRTDGRPNPRAAVTALATGGFIAAYSLVDGLGARAAGTALGFYAWLAIANCVLLGGYLRATAPGVISEIASRKRALVLLGGGASFGAYAIVTWAFTQAPIALVTALRETSIVFALIIGVVILDEELSLSKVFSTFVTLLGATLLRFAR